MSTPEQPNGPGLTRKQLREIRMTGATPVVTPDMVDEAAAASAAPAPESTEAVHAPVADPSPAPSAPEAAEPADDDADAAAEPPAPAPVPPPALDAEAAAAAPALHLPRAAEPAVAAPAPPPDSQVDLGVSPLTRRQARAQERIRTASVPVITPEVAAAHTASGWAPPAPPLPAEQIAVESAATADDAPPDVADEASTTDAAAAGELAAEPVVDAEPDDAAPADAEREPDAADAEPEFEVLPAPVAASGPVVEAELASDAVDEPHAGHPDDSQSIDDLADDDVRPVVQPGFGSGLLAGAGAESAAPFPPSFDELITRGSSSTGSVATPNALILSQSPSGAPLTSPVTATGEVLITGSLALPEGLGSQGHARGAADGKEIDSVLIDGELPAASSPTPIAASAAISTVKGTGEIIRPPAPEKGNKLMLSLAITAGVLAAALIGVLVFALVTGVF